MRFLGFLALVSYGLSSCVTSSNLSTQIDAMTGQPVYKTSPIEVVTFEAGVDKDGRSIQKKRQQGFNMQFTKTFKDSKATYEITVVDGGEMIAPIGILKADSLQIKADEQFFQLSTDVDSSMTERKSPGVLIARTTQTVIYKNVTDDIIAAMANGKDVKIRVKGLSAERIGVLEPEGIVALKKLVVAK